MILSDQLIVATNIFDKQTPSSSYLPPLLTINDKYQQKELNLYNITTINYSYITRKGQIE